MRAHAHSEYRRSGVEWLGDIPQTWKTASLKRNTYIKARVGWKGLTSDEFETESDAYLVTGSDFRGRIIDWAKCYQVSSFRYEDDPFIQLRNGDLLITKDGTIGKTSLVEGLDKDACLNSGIFLVRPLADYESEFLYWVLNSTVFRRFVDLTSSGSTIQHLYQNVFENFAFGFPNIDEQRQITNYLTTNVAKIDVLIEKQERLIETLAERRLAVISHAVTRGLDPVGATKDSGQEWLGRVPASWEVSHLKRTWRVIDCKHVTAEFVADGIPLASIRELQRKWVDLIAAKRTTNEFYQQMIEGDRKPRARDLIFTRNATVGRVAQVPAKSELFAVGQDVCILRPISRTTSSDYQQYLLQSWVVSSQIETLLLGSTFKRINVEQIRDFVLPVPGPEEQVAIVEYLDHETAQMDALSAKAREMIDVLKERRQALISAAVTGKIDVRGLS